MSKTSFDADVLVVGAGPVGLSLAMELGLGGHSLLLIERDASRGPQPRAKTLNMRSLEHFRRWGVADEVREASPLPDDVPTDVIFQTRLYGKHIATLPNIYFRGNSSQHDPRFNEPSEWTPQYEVERVLTRHVTALPKAEIRYATSLAHFEQDASGVTARLVDGDGNEQSIRVKYLVGADGGRSTVREAIGSTMNGRYAYAANYNMVLRIPALSADPPTHRGMMHWLLNEDSPCVMGPIGENWYVAKQLPPGVTGMSDAEIRSLVTGAVGRDVDFEILTVDPWYAHELIADRYRDRRVFLAGDACHLHPPFGGYGMNMGIADAVDIGWKLGAVLQGWGGEILLDSYEFERRRVHQWTIEEAIANYSVLSADMLRTGIEEDGPEGDARRAELGEAVILAKQREFHTIGVVLGYHYGGSPVIDGGETLGPPSAEAYIPVTDPGALAPHVWLGEGVSLYDRLSPSLTLLDTHSGRRTSLKLLEAAAELRVPLTLLEEQSDEVVALYGRGLFIIRPDQHIAWRSYGDNDFDAKSVLEKVTGQKVNLPAYA